MNTCDIVVDVGAVYDENLKRFDHHQRGFEEVFGHGFQTKLSSAGLIYKFVIAAVDSRVKADSGADTLAKKSLRADSNSNLRTLPLGRSGSNCTRFPLFSR